jgi:hypothetical protein
MPAAIVLSTMPMRLGELIEEGQVDLAEAVERGQLDHRLHHALEDHRETTMLSGVASPRPELILT